MQVYRIISIHKFNFIEISLNKTLFNNLNDMEDYEKRAEMIIIAAYKKGGSISYAEALDTIKSDSMPKGTEGVLSLYGDLYDVLIDASNWDTYRLHEKGMNFARSGGFTGENRRGILKWIAAILGMSIS